MSADEQYIRAIDHHAEMQRDAETQTQKLVQTIGKFVVASAALEATYEIELASDIAEQASLEKTASAIADARQSIMENVEEAIRVSKLGFHAKHHQNVLRNELLGDFTADPAD